MKLIEIFEIKMSPDDEMDKIILELYKRKFSVKKINAVNKEEMKKYPDVLKMIKEGKKFPIIRLEGKIIKSGREFHIIRIDGKITNKKQLLRMTNLPKEL